MAELRAAVAGELLKLRRSRAPWLAAVAFTVAAGFGGLFMFILQDPQRARALGLLGAKAQLADAPADWPGYFALLAQITAVGGALIVGLVLIWMFGREFSDHTVTDLLALPTARTTIVAAKFLVASALCLALGVQLYLLGLLIGAALKLPGWSVPVAVEGLGRLLATDAMTVLLITPFALAASAGRGYLAAVGCMFLASFLAQIIAALGYGNYFPWSVPGLYSGVAGPDQPHLGPLSYAGVIAVGICGPVATAAWWRYADHAR